MNNVPNISKNPKRGDFYHIGDKGWVWDGLSWRRRPTYIGEDLSKMTGWIFPPVDTYLEAFPEEYEVGDRYIISADNRIYTRTEDTWVIDKHTIVLRDGLCVLNFEDWNIWIYDLFENTWSPLKKGIEDVFIELDERFPIDYLKYKKDGLIVPITDLKRLIGLIWGGLVTWTGEGFIFDVSLALYYIFHQRYIYEGGQFTLDAADPTHDRIDLVAVNVDEELVVIKGLPAETPFEPAYNTGELVKLISILVKAGSTTPYNIEQLVIYDENAIDEWEGSVLGNVLVNFADTHAPKIGNVCLHIGQFITGAHDRLIFTKRNGGVIDVNKYDTLSFYIKLKEQLSNQFILQVDFREEVSRVVYGSIQVQFDRTLVDTWQKVVINLRDHEFRINSGVLELVLARGYTRPATPNETLTGFYIDRIKLEKSLEVIQRPFIEDIFIEEDERFPIDYLKYLAAGETFDITTLKRLDRLVAGGVVTWGGLGFLFDITEALYFIFKQKFIYAGGQVTLDAAHHTYDRIDLIVLDTNEQAVVIKGTPAETPIEPVYNLGQYVKLTAITVKANTLSPEIEQLLIYDENTIDEWEGIVPVGSNLTSVNFASLLAPKRGVYCIDIGEVNPNLNNKLIFVKRDIGFIDVTSYDSISFDLKLKESVSDLFLLQLAFRRETNNITDGHITVPFDRSLTDVWQKISLSLKGLSVGVETAVIEFILWRGYTRPPTSIDPFDGLFIDHIRLEKGIEQVNLNEYIHPDGFGDVPNPELDHLDVISQIKVTEQGHTKGVKTRTLPHENYGKKNLINPNDTTVFLSGDFTWRKIDWSVIESKPNFYNKWVLKAFDESTGIDIVDGDDVVFRGGTNITITRTGRQITIASTVEIPEPELYDHYLSDHLDVSINSLQTGQLLRYSGTGWENWTHNFLTSFTELDPKGIDTIAVTGSTTKTITITRRDGTTTSANFTDLDTYVHPLKSWVDKTNLSGATVISNLTIDNLGHPTNWVTRNLTPGDIGAAPAHSHPYDNYISWLLKVKTGADVAIVKDYRVQFLQAGATTITQGTGTNTTTIEISSKNSFLTGLSFNTGTGLLTATVSGENNVTVNLDSRYSLIGHTHDYDKYNYWVLKVNGEEVGANISSTLDVVFSANLPLGIVRSNRSLVFSHSDAAGYKHVPSGGAIGDVLVYGGSSGLAAWGAIPAHTHAYDNYGSWVLKVNNEVTGVSITSALDVIFNHTDPIIITRTTRTINISHSNTTGNRHIPSGGTTGQFLKWASEGTASWQNHGLTAVNVGAEPTLTKGLLTSSNGILLTNQTRQIIGGASDISHSDIAGYKHVPSNGAVNNFLIYGGASGVASWSLMTDALHGDRGRGTLHQVVTTTEAGFMSAADKLKLDSISSGANNYTHPSKDWVDKSNLSGAVVISNLTINATGHPTNWTTRSLTPADIGAAAASHTHAYDNYGSWQLWTAGILRASITSNAIVNFVGTGGIDISYGATNNTITINSTNTNYYLTGLSFNIGTGLLTATVIGSSNVTVNLDGRYSIIGHDHYGYYDFYNFWQLKVNNELTGISVTSQADVMFNASDPITITRTTRTLTFSHLGTAGFKHIPSGGSTDQVLIYGGASGTATWGSVPSHIHAYDNYQGWYLQAGGGATYLIASLNNVNFTGAGRTTVSRNLGTIEISTTISTLTNGNGLTGSNYDGSIARTWSVLAKSSLLAGQGAINVESTGISTALGTTATTAAAGNHLHTGVYDNYSSWGMKFGLTTDTVTSGQTVEFVNGTNTTVTRVSARVYRIDASGGGVTNHNLTYHDDVTITSPSTGQLLRYNGSAWVNWTHNFLSSYNETDPVFITWSTTSRSQYFVFAAPNTGSGAPTWRRLLASDISGLPTGFTLGSNVLQGGTNTLNPYTTRTVGAFYRHTDVPVTITIANDLKYDGRFYASQIFDGSARVYSANNTNIGTGALNYAAGNHSHLFTDLTDTPANYTSSANKLVAVNSLGTGLVFIDAPTLGQTVPNFYVTNLTEFLNAYNTIRATYNGGNIYINGTVILTGNLSLDMRGINVYATGDFGMIKFCNGTTSGATVYYITITNGNPTFTGIRFSGSSENQGNDLRTWTNRLIFRLTNSAGSTLTFEKCLFTDIVGGVSGPVIELAAAYASFTTQYIYFSGCGISSHDGGVGNAFELSGLHIRYTNSSSNARIKIYVYTQIPDIGAGQTITKHLNSSSTKYELSRGTWDVNTIQFYTDETAWLSSRGTINSTRLIRENHLMECVEVSTSSGDDYLMVVQNDAGLINSKKITKKDLLAYTINFSANPALEIDLTKSELYRRDLTFNLFVYFNVMPQDKSNTNIISLQPITSNRTVTWRIGNSSSYVSLPTQSWQDDKELNNLVVGYRYLVTITNVGNQNNDIRLSYVRFPAP